MVWSHWASRGSRKIAPGWAFASTWKLKLTKMHDFVLTWLLLWSSLSENKMFPSESAFCRQFDDQTVCANCVLQISYPWCETLIRLPHVCRIHWAMNTDNATFCTFHIWTHLGWIYCRFLQVVQKMTVCSHLTPKLIANCQHDILPLSYNNGFCFSHSSIKAIFVNAWLRVASSTDSPTLAVALYSYYVSLGCSACQACRFR